MHASRGNFVCHTLMASLICSQRDTVQLLDRGEPGEEGEHRSLVYEVQRTRRRKIQKVIYFATRSPPKGKPCGPILGSVLGSGGQRVFAPPSMLCARSPGSPAYLADARCSGDARSCLMKMSRSSCLLVVLLSSARSTTLEQYRSRPTPWQASCTWS